MSPYRKALTAFLIPLVLALGAAMSDGNLTVTEVVAALGAALVTGGGVYVIPNTPTSSGHARL